MTGYLKHIDHVILGLPLVVLTTIGAANGCLEKSPSSTVRTVGWLGVHTAILLGVVSGVPLLAYSLAKTIFAKFLNVMTFNHFKCLRSFQKDTEFQLNATFIIVSTLPLIVLALPQVIRACVKAYQIYARFQKVKEEFFQSELLINLTEAYQILQKILHPTEEPENVEDRSGVNRILA